MKLMAWRCIWRNQKAPLMPILEKSVDRWAFIEILEEELLDVLQEVQDILGDPLFQQDNARIHTAADTMAWFEENNVEVMEWPACLPNLNPIKHCWQCLKDKMHQHYPDIAMTPGGPAKVRAHLAEVLPKIWREEIAGEFLESLWKSMPQRVATSARKNCDSLSQESQESRPRLLRLLRQTIAIFSC